MEHLSPTVAPTLAPRDASELDRWRVQLESLSGRQLETLALLATGLHAHQIGKEMGLREPTVKTHLQHVYRKLGVTNRVEASMRYVQVLGSQR
jgi:DNA-binding NarL/FixJ family response regulator